MVALQHQADDLVTQLQRFRATHTPQFHSIAGIEWQYFSGGCGSTSLLLLPGVHGRGEVAFQHMLRFERNYRVIAPDYPAAATTITSLVDGLMEIMRHEQINGCSIIGGSFSGMVAQCLLRRYPGHVNRVIFDHSWPPSKKRVLKHRIYQNMLAWLPLSLTHALLRGGNQLALLGFPAQRTFWRPYFNELITTLSKDVCISRAQVCIDFHQHYSFGPDALHNWPGTVLIVESDNDTSVPRRERAILITLYPLSRVFTFRGTGHTAWASEFETFHAVMAQFLQEE